MSKTYNFAKLVHIITIFLSIMGVLIHYKGRLQSADLIDTLVAEMEDICDSNKWEYSVLTPAPKGLKTETKSMISLMRMPSPDLQGISFRIHQAAEPVNFVFNKYGILQPPFPSFAVQKTNALKYHWNRADTHPAGIEKHIQLINLLLYLRKKYFKTLEIEDQGGYYPKENKDELAARFATVTNTMGTIRDLMENIELKGEPSDIAAQIQDAISRSLKGKGVEVRVVSLSVEDIFANLLKFIEQLKSENEQDDENSTNDAPKLNAQTENDDNDELNFEFDFDDEDDQDDDNDPENKDKKK